MLLIFDEIISLKSVQDNHSQTKIKNRVLIIFTNSLVGDVSVANGASVTSAEDARAFDIRASCDSSCDSERSTQCIFLSILIRNLFYL